MIYLSGKLDPASTSTYTATLPASQNERKSPLPSPPPAFLWFHGSHFISRPPPECEYDLAASNPLSFSAQEGLIDPKIFTASPLHCL